MKRFLSLNISKEKWKSFIKTLNQENSVSLSEVIESLKLFILPIVKALILKKPMPKYWKASRSWIF